MKKYLFLLALVSCVLGASEVWKLKNIRGKSAVFDGSKVVQSGSDGEFELRGSKGFKVKGGEAYVLDFQCRVADIDGAYVNFYLLGVDKAGRPCQTVAFGSSPGKRAYNRDRMSRLEVPSPHFLNHRIRFKANKKAVKFFPVYESSDGKITLIPGKMTVFENLNRPDIVAEISADSIKSVPGEVCWRSFKLMPEVEYALTGDKNISAGTYELRFVNDAGKVIGSVALEGKVSRFKLPAETKEVLLCRRNGAEPFSAEIKKDFKVDFQRGVYENEWQGTELNRGKAQGKQVAFRRKFTLENAPEYAAVRFLGHNRGELFVNGVSCGTGGQFEPGKSDITKLLKAGENVISVICRNRSGVMRVLFDAYIREQGGKEQLIVSDCNTRYALKMPGDNKWMQPGFDDRNWLPAVEGGSPKDFGDSIIAARVNNRHERLYIGPVKDFTGAKAEIAGKGRAGEKLTVAISAGKGKLPDNGRLIFRAKDNDFDTLLNRNQDGFCAVPRYVPAGKYAAYAAFDRCSFDGKPELFLGNIELSGPEKHALPQFEVRKLNGKSLLFRDGKVISSATYCHGQELSIEVKRINDLAKIKLHMFWIENLERGKDGKFDLTAAIRSLRSMLRQIEHDPDAHILVCASFRPPKKFAKREKYKKELTVTSKGEHLRISGRPGERKYGKPYTDFAQADPHGFSSVSHASQLKIKEYCDAVQDVVKYFEASPYAAKIAGYGFSGEMDGQWHLYAPYSGSGTQYGMVDYSPVMLDFFRAHLKKKYRTDAALQQAWKDSRVTIGTAVIPGYMERVGEKFFVSKRAADYAEAFALAEAELIAALSKAAKDALKRKALVWVYTKDSYRDVGLNQFLPHVLNSGSGFEQYTTAYFDACGNPTDYYFRQNGLHPANRGCFASAHLNKKLKMLEMDLRSYLTQAQQVVWGGDDLNATLNHFRNVLMEGFQYGAPYRFYSFWLGWYNNDAILKLMGKMNEIEQAQLTLPIRWKKRVCHFYDDRAITYMGNFDDKGDRIRHYYFAKSLTGVGANTLNRSGVGFETYYLRDLLNPEFPADQFDVFIFDSCFRFDKKLLAAVESKLRKPGKVLIFPWGSGFLNGQNEVDPAEFEKLTGIKAVLHSIDSEKAMISVDTQAHRLLKNMKQNAVIGARQRYNITPQLPMLKVADPQAVICGKFGDGSAAMAVKNVNGAENIVLLTGDFSADLLRSICKEKNIHIYSGNGYDFVATDGNFMGIHSAVGGVKSIPLPEKVKKAVDFITGEVVAENTDKLEVVLQDDETKILQFEF